MQVLQDNFLYHSNSRFGGDGGLEDERQLLVEEQKLCKARARKFSQETNLRQKALEERRKQWDVQEQRLRENILQQRRQRVQDATERFQRAHLPPSQRRRQSFRRNVPNIEDALSQLQGSLSSYTRQSSFLCSTSNISRSCTPSPKPPTVPKSSHRQALSAVEAYTKLLQEQSMTYFKNSQETGKTQEKLQDHSPRNSHVSDCCISESLSTKTMLRRQALESGRAVRKHCMEQSRQSSGSGNRRLPQPSQPTKQPTEPIRMFSNTCNVAFTDEALESAAQLHLAEVHTEGLLEERDIIAAMETAQTQGPGTVLQYSQQQGLTSISFEEQKILLSLDRLNHQLHCVREHVAGKTGTRGLVLIDAPSTKEIRVTNHLKHRASSANYRSRYLKKF
ncbi:centrosomal protein of 126 kDa isoform X3 [Seriola aureovittata]|uniref:centrosomal protein of 126 kDa isoform X3 n=1 Tax=Seriola aureovittata TaxID=2871759 RepID=UPI0024BE1F1B|nr:centrosomal protein of 126 kDa isoform X3 [Seriola aureovittata]